MTRPTSFLLKPNNCPCWLTDMMREWGFEGYGNEPINKHKKNTDKPTKLICIFGIGIYRITIDTIERYIPKGYFGGFRYRTLVTIAPISSL